jgi:hypothetical protein
LPFKCDLQRYSMGQAAAGGGAAAGMGGMPAGLAAMDPAAQQQYQQQAMRAHNLQQQQLVGEGTWHILHRSPYVF